jgi:hypothetical protein
MKKYITSISIILVALIISGFSYPAHSQTNKKVMFQDFTFVEIKELGENHITVLVPVAQIEAKGPHLTARVDLFTGAEIIKIAAKKEGAIEDTLISWLNFARKINIK